MIMKKKVVKNYKLLDHKEKKYTAATNLKKLQEKLDT
jgi:hypothetical protein